MAEYYTILTQTGKAKLANAQTTGVAVEITNFAVGDGGGSAYNPAESATALVGEVYRAAPNQIYVDAENPSWLVIEVVIPETTGGFYVREAGIFDVDGDMIAIAKYPETYKPALAEGSGKDLYIRMVLEFSNTGDVTLKIDPAIVLATRKYVDDEIGRHESAFDATTSKRGHVELATVGETNAGTDAERAVTPASLSGRTATTSRTGLIEVATEAEALSGQDIARSLTPKGVREAILQQGSYGGSRNYLINGGMDVWQRGNSFPSGSAGYAADRLHKVDTMSIARATDVPVGFRYSAQITPDAGLVARAQASIELVDGRLGVIRAGQTITISCWAKSSSPPTLILTYRDASFSTTNQLNDLPQTQMSGVADGAWRRFILTHTLVNDAPSTSTHLLAEFGFQNADEIIKLTGLQIEPGPVATPFEHRHYGEELALCQRFYENSLGYGVTAYEGDGGGMRAYIRYRVRKRTIPTISFGPLSNFTFDSTNQNPTGLSSGGISMDSFKINAANNSFNINDADSLQWGNPTDVEVDAEF